VARPDVGLGHIGLEVANPVEVRLRLEDLREALAAHAFQGEKASRDPNPRGLIGEAAGLLVENEPLDQAREGTTGARDGARRE
jgi:hypothetical protein